jgi:hypothetical protein
MNEKKFPEILTRKLRELELICAPLKADEKPGQIDLELAIDKTMELRELLATHLGQAGNSASEILAQKQEQAPVSETKKAIPYINIIRDSTREKEETMVLSDQEEAPSPEEEIVVIEEEKIQVESKQEVEQTIEPVEKADKIEGKTIIADKFQSKHRPFINENLGKSKSGKDISSKIQSKPISDLRASIGINEKFLFIKELFKGNNEYYNKSIDFLNQAGSLDNAMQYIHENFQWDRESETTTKFLELVQRKFIK